MISEKVKLYKVKSVPLGQTLLFYNKQKENEENKNLFNCIRCTFVVLLLSYHNA